jgi:microcystin-dependent protein
VDAYIGEIRLVSFNYPPRGWAFCNGQLLPINQNQALFSLLGTTFGGNGQTTFALPDLRGRVPLHVGSGHTLGERAGEEAHTVSLAEMPAHLHPVGASSVGATTQQPAGNFLAAANDVYRAPTALRAMHPATVSNTGGSQPHENRQPLLVLSFCIALQGIFPSRN